MAQTILSSLLSPSSLSIVSSNSDLSLDIASSLKVARVGIRLCSYVMRHMREDGNTIVDARIIQPTKIEIDVFCQSIDDLAMVNSVMLDRNSTYTIKSRGLIFDNMMMDREEIRQSPEVISASPVRMSFKQLLVPGIAIGPNVAQAADSSLVDHGLQDIKAIVSGAVTNAQQLAQQIISKTGL